MHLSQINNYSFIICFHIYWPSNFVFSLYFYIIRNRQCHATITKLKVDSSITSIQQAILTQNCILCHKLCNKTKRCQFHFPYSLHLWSYRQKAPCDRTIYDPVSPVQLHKISLNIPYFFFPSYPNLSCLFSWQSSVLVLFSCPLRF